MTIALQAKTVKVTLLLDPVLILGASKAIDEATGRVPLRVSVAGRTITADVAAKSLRRTLTSIREAGPDGIAVILQGVLMAGDVLSEASIAAQLKAPKPAVAVAA